MHDLLHSFSCFYGSSITASPELNAMPVFATSAVSATSTADDTFSIHRMFPFLPEKLRHSSQAVPMMTPGDNNISEGKLYEPEETCTIPEFIYQPTPRTQLTTMLYHQISQPETKQYIGMAVCQVCLQQGEI